jgi:hypothetical protein
MAKATTEKVSLNGNQSQKVINKFRRIAEVVFHEDLDEETINQEGANITRTCNATLLKSWHGMADNMGNMWTLIEQHEDCMDQQLDQLHLCRGKFISQWIDIAGKVHVTNYIHILGSGHLTYFASKYKNLYKFSQQGWESLNQLIKHFYFNNTNHGGSAGNGGKNAVGQYVNGIISGDHCRPLMRLCQRSIMWKLDLGNAYFRNNL